ncbi:SDR family NAD(P)-dependent oxidoreductase [Nonomuraea ferruginea]
MLARHGERRCHRLAHHRPDGPQVPHRPQAGRARPLRPLSGGFRFRSPPETPVRTSPARIGGPRLACSAMETLRSSGGPYGEGTPMDLQFSGRVAIVTGASKGIGLAVTRTLLGEGASVVAVSRKASPELAELGGDLLHVPVDLMDPEAPGQAVARAVEEFGGLDILVNNAGGPPPGVALPRFSFMAPPPTRTGGPCSSSTCSRWCASSGPPSRRCWRAAAARSSTSRRAPHGSPPR